jgi:diacylglycerol kinase
MSHAQGKFLKAFAFAFRGIRSAFLEQRNLRIHAAVAALALTGGFYFGIRAVEWCIVLLSIALVIGLEMVNSALENVVDLVTRERHPLAGKAKDMAAGAVLFASVIAAVVGVIIFAPYIFS